MCGAPLQAAAAPAPKPTVPTPPPVPRSAEGIPAKAPVARATTAQVQVGSRTVHDNVPPITGPSFLGLNQPPPRSSNLNRESRLGTSSGNLDYLLEDDEEESKGSAGKIFLIVLALALALGFGYL